MAVFDPYFFNLCEKSGLREVVSWQIKNKELTEKDVLNSLTNIRRQTAIDNQTSVADKGSLRSFRVIIRQLEFTADLVFDNQPSDEILSLLYVSTLSLRRVGSGRNRGRGNVKCTLHNITEEDSIHYVNLFGQIPEIA